MNKLPIAQRVEIIPSSNPIIADLIHTIIVEDIQDYAFNKYKHDLATPDTMSRMSCEAQRLIDEFRATGYEVVSIYDIRRDVQNKIYKAHVKEVNKLKKQIKELKKELKRLKEAKVNGTI